MTPQSIASYTSNIEPAGLDDGVDLRQYLAILLRRRRVIIAVTAAAVAAATLFSFLSPPVYESQVVIQLSPHSNPVYAAQSSAIQVLTSRGFLSEVRKKAGVPESAEGLRGLLKVEPIRDTQMVRVKVRYQDPRHAQAVAQAIADRFIARAAEQVNQKQRIAADRLAQVEAQLTQVEWLLGLSRDALARLQQNRGLPARGDGFATSFALNATSISAGLREGLQQTRTQLRSDLLTLTPPQLVEAPTSPIKPIAPPRLLNIGLGLLLGLVTGAAMAMAIEALSPMLSSRSLVSSSAAIEAGGSHPQETHSR